MTQPSSHYSYYTPQPVRPRRLAVWIWLIPLLSVAMILSSLWCYYQNLPLVPYHPDFVYDTSQMAIGLFYPILGAFIAQRRMTNTIGWIFCLMGLFSSLYQFSYQYAIYAYFTLPSPLLLAAEMAWLESWAWFVPIVLLILLVMVYPNGQPLTPRWRIPVWLLIACLAYVIFLTLVFIWPARGPLILFTPSQLPPQATYYQQMMSRYGLPAIALTIFVCLPLAILSLVIRLKRSRGIEERQIKWFLFAGIELGIVLIFSLILDFIPGYKWIGNLLWNVFLPFFIVGIPIAVGFAILRHRLYDIDLIIRRTLMYAALTAILILVYLLTVILLQDILRSIIGSSSPVAVMVSTLLIATLFTPLRQRLQNLIDKRFYRSRYNIEHALSVFGPVAQNEVDLDLLSHALLETVDEAIQPEKLSLWLRKPPV